MTPDRRPIRQRLAAHFTEAQLDLWIYRPNPDLWSLAPYQLVDAGRAEEVHQLIDRLDAGAYV
ncbi:DUF2384 domain-containing protein [Sinirhodobacter populi]|uniref:DUF2384 domain-containing protein n=1 Tax=Paenirhodobacter populi TaxID=2306993 RepID=A0A443K206_9RHOB|nr:antitoxin Xre/MbcA/ParS toxin-binding domain-containing protein [Sinirhodobacter populi]RWR26799.1 DUF2384 domain-containing protein [Sinirhodobacter populi]